MESVTKPEGYPYFTYKCITERPVYIKDEEREISYYEAGGATIYFPEIIPFQWYKYRVWNPETDKLEACVVFDYIDSAGNHHEVMAAESVKSFDMRIKQWIEYRISTIKDDGTPE